MTRPTHDVAVIGGGIVGLATAMALAERHRLRPLVLEAEPALASHQTGHNSGVIHSGLYYRAGSLKAQLCVAGRDALYAFCAAHGIPVERCGKLVVAVAEHELPALDELERRGRANGLDGMQRLGPEALREHEPEVAGIAGLFVPHTGIVDFGRVARGYATVVRSLGGEIRTSARVTAVVRESAGIVCLTSVGDFRARALVNCAGLYSDRVARLCDADPGVAIVPFRGEYYTLRPERHGLVRNLIYPVPDPAFPFLGVHFTRRIDGRVECGPNAVLAFAREGYRWSAISARDLTAMAAFPGTWRLLRRLWRSGLGEMHRSLSRSAFVRALQRLVPALRDADIAPGGAGVRAQAVGRDGALLDDFFVVERPRMVHVLNAPSPAATASIAIGAHVAGLVAERLARDG